MFIFGFRRNLNLHYLSHTVNRLEFHTTAEEGMEERSKQFFSNNVQNSFVGQDTIVSHGM